MNPTRPILGALFLLLGVLCGQQVQAANTESTSTSGNVDPTELLLQTLEDPQRRDRLIAALRAAAEGDGGGARDIGPVVTVRAGGAELLQSLSTRIGELTHVIVELLDGVQELPQAFSRLVKQLGEPEARERWLGVVFDLAVVIGAGWFAATLVGFGLGRLVRRTIQNAPAELVRRLMRLLGIMLAQLLPVAAFALAAFATLTLVDPEPDTRLVALALVNAAVITRLLRILSNVTFAPDAPGLRLWQIEDETAHYLDQWTRRLVVVAVYGFVGLQAALLLGLSEGIFELGLNLLGLLLLGLLLVLIAQNREPLARVIAAESEPGSDEPRSVSSLRKGLARVWHLLASAYLVAVYLIWALEVEDGGRFVLQATLVSLVVFAVARLLTRLVNGLFERGLRLSTDLGDRFPGLEQRLNRYFPALRKVAKLLLAVVAALLIANAWGLDTLGWFASDTGSALLGAVVNIVLIVAVALLVWEFASGGVERYLSAADANGSSAARSPRVRTLLTVARNALLVVLAVVATLMVLSELGINIAPLLAGAGVVGLAIGFGAQRLVQDVINGAFILFQDLMSVGDVVKLGDKAGLVEALSIRTVRLRDLAGVVHTIPFSAIEGVSNLTREFSCYVFDLGIAYRENVDEVIALLREIGAELQADAEIGPLILEPLEVFGLDAFGDSAIVIKGRIKTQPIRQWQVGRAFNRLVKVRLDERGIEIPFPHTTVYFGQDKDGSAPPAFVQVEAMLRDGGASRAVTSVDNA